MPCQDSLIKITDSQYYKMDVIRAKEILNEVTQSFCYLCGELVDKGVFEEHANDRIKKWWENHLKKDEERVTEEMTKYINDDDNKNKLADEIAVLFIKKAEKIHPVSSYHKRWFIDIANKVIENKNKIRNALNKLSEEEKLLLFSNNKNQ